MKKRIISFLTSLVMVISLSSVVSTLNVYATQDRSYNFSKSFSITGNGADDIVNVARAQIGKNGSSLGYTEQWCADFVGDCAALANQSSAIPRNGYCPSLQNAILNAGGSQVSISSARKGDIAFYGTNGADHVEIVYANNSGRISTIGGNSGSGSSLYSRMVRDHSSQTMTITKVFRPNYRNVAINPPSNLNITTDKAYYKVGETITFSFTGNDATELYIPIDYNGVRSDFINVSGRNSYTCSFNQPGWYGFFLYAKNSSGESSTVGDYKNVRVDNTAPSNLSISTNKTIYYASENVSFSFSGTNAAELYIPIDVNGTREHFIDVSSKTTYSHSFTTTGVYNYTLYGKNAVSDCGAPEYQSFYVFNKPNLGNEFYAKIKVKAKPEFLLSNVSDDLILQSEDNNKSLEQTWKFIKNNDGSYEIISLSSGNAIDLENWTDTDFANVALHEYANTTNQNWNVYEINDNVYCFKPQCSNTRSLDIPYEKFANGTSIKIHEFTNSSAQEFIIEKVVCPHNYSEKITKHPTCTSTGEKTLTCSICGESKTETIPATGHSYTETVVAPTTTEQGYTLHKCSVCGDEYKDNFTDPVKEQTTLGGKVGSQRNSKGALRFIAMINTTDAAGADTAYYNLKVDNKLVEKVNVTKTYKSFLQNGKTSTAPAGNNYIISNNLTNLKSGQEVVFELYFSNFDLPLKKTYTVS